jgi:hypothetical protein
MSALIEFFDAGSRSVTILLAGVIAALVAALVGHSMSVGDVIDWARQNFGPTFLALLTVLVLLSLYSLQRMRAEPGKRIWLEAGMQAAGRITTLALTYTLMGISLGIGTLAEQNLTPDTVQEIIRGLTEQFSMAFMTTVAGLPIVAILRSVLLITHARNES